jgi:hypothetical protein
LINMYMIHTRCAGGLKTVAPTMAMSPLSYCYIHDFPEYFAYHSTWPSTPLGASSLGSWRWCRLPEYDLTQVSFIERRIIRTSPSEQKSETR